MERVWSTLRRGISAQSILMFVLTVFIAALLWATFGNQTSASAITPVANWKGETIIYDGHQYYSAPEAKAGDSHGLPQGTHLYVHVTQPTGAAKTQKAFIIYFTPGVDPPTATSASYVEYDYSSSKVFSNPQGAKTIALTVKGEEASVSSCSVDGIGWIICPIAVFLADGMDTIFNIVSGFLAVQPSIIGDPNNDLYVAWNIMRSIANIAFIIVFLIIIYSQLTSVGVSNYGLKKLLPRLVVASVLVNLSFFITALAVDISNILGYSLQDIFIQIRQETFNIDNDTWSDSTTAWADVTGFVLGGGAAVGGVVAFSIASAGSGGVIYLLLPLLVGLILTILFVLLILAARQAIIIILIVIAPLAFVAYLLPNTEKWFDKWRDLFMTMLIFFPAFSLVFGGSQLAGGIIIQNATNVLMMIFGLAVQVAPLVITPLLLKLSGGLLGKIAGLVNDPRKGLMDRTKNWSKDRAEMHRLNSLKKPGTVNPFRRIAQGLDNNSRRVKDRTSQYQTENDNRYHNTDGYARIHENTFAANQEKEFIEQGHKAHIQNAVNSRGSDLHMQNVRLEAMKANVDSANKETETQLDEYRSGRVAVTGELTNLVNSLRTSHEEVALSAIRRKSANDVTDGDWSARFISEDHLQIIAGGVGGQKAANVALASAIAAEGKAHVENVSAARALADHFKLNVTQRDALARNDRTVPITGTDSSGNTRTFDVANDAYLREVAIVDTVKAAPYGMGANIIMQSNNNDFAQFRDAIAGAMEAGNWEAKGSYFDGETRDALKQGAVTRDYLKQRAAEFLVNGKLSADVMAGNHKNTLALYIETAQDLRNGTIVVPEDKYASGNLDPTTGLGSVDLALERVKKSAETAYDDVRIEPRLGDRKDLIKEIKDNF